MDRPAAMETDSGEASDSLLADSRSYQLEMFQESLRRNVIVAVSRRCHVYKEVNF